MQRDYSPLEQFVRGYFESIEQLEVLREQSKQFLLIGMIQFLGLNPNLPLPGGSYDKSCKDIFLGILAMAHRSISIDNVPNIKADIFELEKVLPKIIMERIDGPLLNHYTVQEEIYAAMNVVFHPDASDLLESLITFAVTVVKSDSV